jgi:hypothetical protein
MEKSEVIKQYKELVSTQYGGNTPTFSLFKKRYPSLAYQIEKCGGYLHIKKLSGFNSFERNPPNYWSVDRIQKCISSISPNKKFPTKESIKRNFGSGIIKAINKLGGSKKVSSILGCQLNSCLLCSDGHHVQSSYEYLLDEFLNHHKVPHEVGGVVFPGLNFRYDFKVGNVCIEIWGCTGGWKKEYDIKRVKKELLYSKFNIPLISLEAEWFKNKSIIESKFLDILKITKIKGNQNQFIIANYINHSKYWNYENTVAEFNVLKNKLGKKPCTKDVDSVRGLKYALGKHGGLRFFNGLPKNWNDDAIEKALRNIAASIGHFPTSTELRHMRFSGLLSAIEVQGKINKFREKLGYTSIKKNNNYWSEDRILQDLIMIKNALGRFPKTTDLPQDLRSAIYNKNKTLKYFTSQISK